MIRTLVADDLRVAGAHAGFVEEVYGFTVVGTAHTATEARARVRELSPDLVLLDVSLPDESGIAVLPELQTDTIVLSAAIDPKSIRTAIRAGALNYLIKPVTHPPAGRTSGQLLALPGFASPRPWSQQGGGGPGFPGTGRARPDTDAEGAVDGDFPAGLRQVEDRSPALVRCGSRW